MSKVAEIVTERFIKALDEGTVPWRRPWRTQRPFNLKSKREYQGVNMLMLGLAGYSDPRWATYKQVTELGGTVSKGQHGWPVVFFKMIPDKNHKPVGDERQRTIPLLRYTTAFNVEQCEGIEITPLVEGEAIVSNEYVADFIAGCGIEIKSGSIAAYNMADDIIILPPLDRFTSEGSYFSTAFHEMIHATGHESRLERFTSASGALMGSESYSKEELIAEIGASILRADMCVETDDEFAQSAAYIAGWKQKLTDEPNLILSAARQGENAVTWLKEASASGDQSTGMLEEFAEEMS